QEVFRGEVWRLVTFLFVPPFYGIPIFFVFYCLLFYLIGIVLEQTWGTARFNVFLLVGYVCNVAAALGLYAATGINIPAPSGFIYSTLFLSFAYLYPDFVLMIYFILPVKVKWLGWLQWAGYAFGFAFGNWMVRVSIVASVANFFLFFGGS